MGCSTYEGVGGVWQGVKHVVTDKGDGRIVDNWLQYIVGHLTVSSTYKTQNKRQLTDAT